MESILAREAQEQRHAIDLALLLEASNLLSASLEPRVVIERLTLLLAKAAGADLVTLFTFSEGLARCISVYGPWLDPKLSARLSLIETPLRTESYPSDASAEPAAPTAGPVERSDLPADIRAELKAAGIKSFAALPLVRKGRRTGVAYVYTRGEPTGLDDATLALLQGLASQAAAALEHARLHQTLKEYAITLEQRVSIQTAELLQRNHQLLVLNETLVAINESTNLEDTLVAVVERLRYLLDSDECSLFLLEDVQGRSTMITSVRQGRPSLVMPQPIHGVDSGLWQRLQAAEGILRLDAGELQSLGVSGRTVQAGQVIVCPLRYQSRVLGMVLMRDPQHEEWEQWTGFYRALGDQIGLAVQNARLHHAAQEQAERLKILLEVGQDLNSSLKFQEVLNRAVVSIHEYVPDVNNCAISLLEDDGQRLHLVSQWSKTQTRKIRSVGDRVPLAELTESRIAIETARPVMKADLWQDAILSEEQQALRRHIGVRALLYVPILGKEGPMGLIHVSVLDKPRVFEPREVELLQGVAAQLALALENVRLLEAVQEHAAAAQARAQELDAFTYTISHDLKAPLGNLQGFAEVLAEDYAEVLDEPGRHYLGRIQANVQTMAQMIDELLLLSRLERDERPPEPVDLGPLIASIQLQLYPEIQARSVTLRIAEEMPTVLGHEIWLEQVFMNLISNAIKFMEDDHPDPQVDVGWAPHEEGALFWVQDNGVGIAEEDQARVFELFTRLHRVRRKGTGLGLPIVRQVIERAHGRIWIESDVGKGSRFCFIWPATL
jgi:signal transduction histidine kinase